jgi:Fur family transcriptional regulator, peroxide stress response regulator
VKKSRNTRQRAVILEVLKSGPVHLTAEEVYRQARQVLPTVSLGTVYRNLNFLRQKGLAREVRGDDGGSGLFEAIRDAHAHFHCRGCHVVRDIPLPDALASGNWGDLGGIGSVQTVDLHIIGDCVECASHGAGRGTA